MRAIPKRPKPHITSQDLDLTLRTDIPVAEGADIPPPLAAAPPPPPPPFFIDLAAEVDFVVVVVVVPLRPASEVESSVEAFACDDLLLLSLLLLRLVGSVVLYRLSRLRREPALDILSLGEILGADGAAVAGAGAVAGDPDLANDTLETRELVGRGIFLGECDPARDPGDAAATAAASSGCMYTMPAGVAAAVDLEVLDLAGLAVIAVELDLMLPAALAAASGVLKPAPPFCFDSAKDAPLPPPLTLLPGKGTSLADR